MKKLILGLFLIGSTVEASLLTVNTSTGDNYFLDILPEDSFEQVMDTLQKLEHEATKDTFCVNFNFFDNIIEAKTKSTVAAPRNYYATLSSKDKENISYLLNTLAYQSAIKIASKKSSLTKTGDQIEHLHPLLFLKFVFTNDEMIVAIRNIKDRSWLWKDFIGRILDSLNTEMSIGNITSDQINNLAAAIKLDPTLIHRPIQAHNWSELVDSLILNVQRENDSNRYDM